MDTQDKSRSDKQVERGPESIEELDDIVGYEGRAEQDDDEPGFFEVYGRTITKYGLVLGYGISAMFLIALSFFITCQFTNCYFYARVGGIGCPYELTIPLAFISFMMGAGATMVHQKVNFWKALMFGMASVIALYISTTIMVFAKPGCPVLSIADVGIYTTFITSAGSMYLNYGKEPPKKSSKGP
jgi:hypothetical protein